jgi:hypothetical protein
MNGAKVDVSSGKETRMLHNAVRRECTYLMDVGKDTAVHIACKYELWSFAHIFIFYGADCAITNQSGQTRLHMVCKVFSLDNQKECWELVN